ncbi:hypothetical protein D3C75_860230 [compost metagenome]
MFQRFGDGFPAELNQFFCIRWVGAFFHQLVEAQQGTRLQHAAQNSLLTHQVRFNFCNKRRFQNTSTMTASCSSPGFSDSHAFAFRIVFWVNRNQSRNTETTFVFFTNFSTRAFWRNHHHGDVLTDLLAHFNHVKTVGVTQCCTIFHHRLNSLNNRRVLLVWRQVNNQIRLRDQFFVGANFKTVFGRFTP